MITHKLYVLSSSICLVLFFLIINYIFIENTDDIENLKSYGCYNSHSQSWLLLQVDVVSSFACIWTQVKAILSNPKG